MHPLLLRVLFLFFFSFNVSKICLPLCNSLEITLVQWFSTKGNFVPRWTLSNVWKHFHCSILGIAMGVQWVESRNLLKILQCTGKLTTTKNYLSQNVSCVETTKSWVKQLPKVQEWVPHHGLDRSCPIFCSDGNVLRPVLSIMVANSHMWLLNIWNMGSATEKLDL